MENKDKGTRQESFLSKNFSTIVGLLIAIVTIVGALAGWRSAVAGDQAGNEDDAGIFAALSLQETNTISSIISSQNHTNYLHYWYNKQLLNQLATDGTLDNIPAGQEAEVLREVNEAADLATASKGFFPAQYLTADGGYDATREQAEAVAEAAQKKDLDAQTHFDQANTWRDKSLAFVAALVVLGISLWLLAAAEVIEHKSRVVFAIGGFVFLLIGAYATWAIETNVPLTDVYNLSSLLSYITGGLVVVGLIASVFVKGSSPAAAHEDDDAEGRGSWLSGAAGLLIVTVALLGAGVAWLQADAGVRGDSAIRKSQLESAQALGVQATGEAQVNFQFGGAAQTYEELTVLANAATEAGDAKAAARYLAIQKNIIPLSELLRAPYFNEATDAGPSVANYQADQYVGKASTLAAASALGGNVENAWTAKSNTYIIHLTILAAALALLGLSLTFKGIVRPLFVGVGSVLVAITMVWVVVTYLAPVPQVSQDAVDSYGKGVAADYRGDTAAAITAYSDAISKAPDYGVALYARGDAQSTSGNYEAAINDFKAAQAAGLDDANVAWDLGYSYYLTGKFDDAINSYKHALEVDPKRVWVRLDLAIAYLAQGKATEAQAEYTKAKDDITAQVVNAKAAGQEPPPSILYYLDAGADDLESLVSQLDDSAKDKPGAPSKDKITDVAAVEKVAQEQFSALKSLAVGLEFNGKPPAGPVTATVGDFQFGLKKEGDTFDVADSFSSETKDIWIIYNYDGMKDGQQVVWKVYINGNEYPEYRTIETWNKGATGNSSQPLTDDFAYGSTYSFAPGEYTVEMYVDSGLVQRGFFTVEPAKP
ncbi:MAG: tetratricopeptide repeat protein [Chloroflexia bacterium]